MFTCELLECVIRLLKFGHSCYSQEEEHGIEFWFWKLQRVTVVRPLFYNLLLGLVGSVMRDFSVGMPISEVLCSPPLIGALKCALVTFLAEQ